MKKGEIWYSAAKHGFSKYPLSSLLFLTFSLLRPEKKKEKSEAEKSEEKETEGSKG